MTSSRFDPATKRGCDDLHIAVLIIMCIGKSRGGNYIVTQLAVLFFFFVFLVGKKKKRNLVERILVFLCNCLHMLFMIDVRKMFIKSFLDFNI